MKQHRTVCLCAGLCIGATALPLAARDINNGKLLHDANCLRCHSSEIYLRESRKIKTYEGLRKRVRQCQLASKLAWFDEEVDDVIAYLNATYYFFDKQ